MEAEQKITVAKYHPYIFVLLINENPAVRRQRWYFTKSAVTELQFTRYLVYYYRVNNAFCDRKVANY